MIKLKDFVAVTQNSTLLVFSGSLVIAKTESRKVLERINPKYYDINDLYITDIESSPYDDTIYVEVYSSWQIENMERFTK